MGGLAKEKKSVPPPLGGGKKLCVGVRKSRNVCVCVCAET